MGGEDGESETGARHGVSRFDVIIVGTGHGGAQSALMLRRAGFDGSIALVGEETELPYERPPLSKDYLAGEKSFDRLLIRPPGFWTERGIQVVVDCSVVAVDPARHRITAADGREFGYRHLVWAAGAAARTLDCPGRELPGVHTIRTRADVDTIRAALDGRRRGRVVVIGAGYIGLEVSAVLAAAGRQVTVLETQDRVLARVAGAALSRFYESQHRLRGVDLRLGAKVECVEGGRGGVAAVRLASGETIPCNIVIVGIGIIPNVGPLLLAGAKGGEGVEVDGQCRTSLADVFAVGDCALHVNRYAGGALVRLESVQNAVDQATVVAKTLSGERVHYDEVPWFWSKQYDIQLQTVGLSGGYEEQVLRGDPTSSRFSVVYLRDGSVIALDCVNSMRDFVQGKRLVARAVRLTTAQLRDATIALKDM